MNIKRDVSIDIARGLGIILVILGHTKCPTEMHDLIYSFHMPLFFIIAGYLFNFNKWKLNYIGFVINRFKRLVVPYFLLQIFIFYPLWYFLGRYFGESKELNLSPTRQFIGIFYGNGVDHWLDINTPLWFLLCLFVSECIFITIMKCFDSNVVRILVVASLVAIGYVIKDYYLLPWSIDIAFVVQFFLLVGNYMQKSKIKENIIIMLLTLISLYCLSDINTTVDTNSRLYKNIVCYLINGILGTYIIVCFSNILSKVVLICKVLQYIGKESLTILAWHTWGFKFASLFFVYYMNYNLYEAKTDFYIIYLLISLCMCCFIIFTIDMISNKWNKCRKCFM